MDTRGVLEADWKRLKKAQDCGEIKIFAITDNGAFTIDSTCKNWDCLKCIKVRISIFQELLNENITGPHVFISHIGYRGKQLTKWIQKNKPPVSTFFYFEFQTVKGSILISSHRFQIHPPLKRMSKWIFRLKRPPCPDGGANQSGQMFQ